METKHPHHVVKLKGRRAGSKKDTDAIVLLVGVLLAAMFITADLLLRIPQALDSVVSPSLAAPGVFAPSNPQPVFHEAYPIQSGADAGEWPTF